MGVMLRGRTDLEAAMILDGYNTLNAASGLQIGAVHFQGRIQQNAHVDYTIEP